MILRLEAPHSPPLPFALGPSNASFPPVLPPWPTQRMGLPAVHRSMLLSMSHGASSAWTDAGAARHEPSAKRRAKISPWVGTVLVGLLLGLLVLLALTYHRFGKTTPARSEGAPGPTSTTPLAPPPAVATETMPEEPAPESRPPPAPTLITSNPPDTAPRRPV
ncbi:MAG TPA: hypothetical protein VM580_13630, partial [Labilithrix sp.]|nr:hypothetical protein [Labilithrix sp.]